MVDGLTIGLFIIAFLLGMKHSLDADHVVAISSILTRAPNLAKTMKLSVSWALGHMVTATIITFILFQTKEFFFDKVLANFEIVVAFMLIFIGVITLLWEFDVITIGKHTHGHIHETDANNVHTDHIHDDGDPKSDEVVSLDHSHFLSFKKDTQAIAGIGVVHGLASNDELFILLTLTLGLNSFTIVFIGLLIFSSGVVFGMVLWGSILNIPILRARKENITKTLSVGIGALAIVYGFYILFGGEGVNLFPVVTG